MSLSSLQVIAQNDFFDRADAFFQHYVSQGSVNYYEVKQDQKKLNELIDFIESNAVLTVNNDQDKALLINAYNLFVIQGIVDRYPVSSPQEIASFFDTKRIKIQGKTLSLNELEKDILIKQTKDLRLHFVLVCGAKGCPKIINVAYRPDQLDQQMDRQTRITLNDDEFTKINNKNKTAVLSEIFEWYRKDFLGNQGSIISFINRYRERRIGPAYEVSYYSYDWTLNDVEKENGSQGSSTSNLLQFTPSQLFRKGQYEINVFSNLYSQISTRDRQGNEAHFGNRSSILTNTIQWTYGVSTHARTNVGLDVILSGGATGFANGSNHFQLFSGNKNASDFAVTGIGPRIKVQPFKKCSFYSIQSSLIIPVAKNPEQGSQGVFLALNRYLWRNQFFYDFKLSSTLRLFYEVDINYFIRKNKEEVFFQPNFVDLPFTVFLTYFPSNKFSMFVMGQSSYRYGRTSLRKIDPNGKFGLLQWYLQVGGGAKYQLNSNIGFELSYGNFIAGRGFEGFEVGAGKVANLGIRFIR